LGAELREAGPVGGRTDVGVTAVGGGDETGRGEEVWERAGPNGEDGETQGTQTCGCRGF